MVDCEGCGGSRQPGRKKSCIIISVIVAALILIIIIAQAPSTQPETSGVNANDSANPSINPSVNVDETFFVFTNECKKFEGYDCQKIWHAFEQAYVGCNECDVPMEAYDPVFALAPFKHNYSRTLLWSNFQDFVEDFNDKKRCFAIMKDTVLGAAVDASCRNEWKDCENYTVRSFWRGYSAKFAEAARGQVTAMLNGSSDPPVKPTSIFENFEVPRLNPTKVQSLNVVLVTPQTSVVDCTHPSFTRLRQKLKPGIQYSCKEVPESQIQECKNNKEKPCKACW